MSELQRHAPRIEPPSPTTVAIEDDGGVVHAYGIVSDVSKTGGCFCTNALLKAGITVHVRLSFSSPSEVHTLACTVVWTRPDPTSPRGTGYRCGVTWIGASYDLRERLRQLVNQATPRFTAEPRVFESRWVVPKG